MWLPLRATASSDRLSLWWQENTKVPELERQRLKCTPTLSAPISSAIFTCHWLSFYSEPSFALQLKVCFQIIPHFLLSTLFLPLSHNLFVPFCFFPPCMSTPASAWSALSPLWGTSSDIYPNDSWGPDIHTRNTQIPACACYNTWSNIFVPHLSKVFPTLGYADTPYLSLTHTHTHTESTACPICC